MANGGNKPWKDFFDAHQSNKMQGRTFDECTIQERYDSEAGEEWKERLTAKVEGKEYVPGTKSSGLASRARMEPGTATSAATSRSQTPIGRTASPTQGGIPSQKAQNEQYFARMGEANASRPDGLAPSQGGKYAGFGSDPTPARSSTPNALPGIDDLQKDPVAALTKGFGWLSSTVGKQANASYNGFIKPNLQKLSEADIAAQARMTAAQLGQTVQGGTKTLAESFNQFVEGDDRLAPRAGKGPEPEKKDFWDSFGDAPKGPSSDKKDFWDDFSATAGEVTQAKTKPTSIGTAAMKKPGGGAQKKDEDSWGW